MRANPKVKVVRFELKSATCNLSMKYSVLYLLMRLRAEVKVYNSFFKDTLAKWAMRAGRLKLFDLWSCADDAVVY